MVPRAHLAEVVELATAVAEREAEWRRRIAAGATLPAVTGIDAILAEVRGQSAPPAP